MSIISTVFIKSGIIMSSDSRLTARKTINGVKETRYADRLPKTFLIKSIDVGVSYCGNAEVDGMIFHEFIKEFINSQVSLEDTATTVAEKIASVKDKGETIFVICGYVNDEPHVYCVGKDIITRMNTNNENNIFYSKITFGLDEAVKRHYANVYAGKVNYRDLALGEGIKISEELVDVAIKNEKGCGYPISTLVITPTGSIWKAKNAECQEI